MGSIHLKHPDLPDGMSIIVTWDDNNKSCYTCELTEMFPEFDREGKPIGYTLCMCVDSLKVHGPGMIVDEHDGLPIYPMDKDPVEAIKEWERL